MFMNKPSTDVDRRSAMKAELERRLFELRQQIAQSERKARQASGGRRRPLRETIRELLAEAEIPLN